MAVLLLVPSGDDGSSDRSGWRNGDDWHERGGHDENRGNGGGEMFGNTGHFSISNMVDIDSQ
jgi:hypothetical protein